jgi:hypothetical protein
MGKETSTTGEKQSPPLEARHVEQITKIDADNSQTNDDSKVVPDGSLLVNAPDEKQGAKEARRADRKERITKRAPGELDSTKVVTDSEEEKQAVTEIAEGRDGCPRHIIEKQVTQQEEQTRRERKPRHQHKEIASPRQPDEGLLGL